MTGDGQKLGGSQNVSRDGLFLSASDFPKTVWSDSESWLAKLLFNLFSYGFVVAPVLLFVWVAKSRNWFETGVRSRERSCWLRILESLAVESREPPASLLEDASEDSEAERPGEPDWLRKRLGDARLLIFCSTGLLVSYLTWGVLQEKIMTGSYRVALSVSDAQGRPWTKFVYRRFTDSQFVVLVNRLAAFLIASFYVAIFERNDSRSRRRRPPPPGYRYLYASLSNVTSSWCQYEALKYIAFPVQVLGKASKIIPTMIMGKFVERKSYPWHQYVTGLAVSAGVGLFLLLGSEEPRGLRKRAEARTTTWSGAALLLGYLACDSFTTNWQAALFHRHRVSSVRMMRGINFFSILLTSTSVLAGGRGAETVTMVLGDVHLLADLLLTSACSAVGQLFIFYTISSFGAVNFSVIMTVRQAASILLSCWIFGHGVTSTGYLGLFLAFGALIAQRFFKKRRPAKKETAVV